MAYVSKDLCPATMKWVNKWILEWIKGEQYYNPVFKELLNSKPSKYQEGKRIKRDYGLK